MMIDQRYQRMGFGRRAIRLVLAHARSRPGVEKLHTSYWRGEGSPETFYEKLGFTAVAFGTSPPPESTPDVEYRWTPRQEPVRETAWTSDL